MKGGARQDAGRKKGSGQAAHYRAMLEPYAEQLMQRVVGIAKEGDMAETVFRPTLCASESH
jgi:hypothetical protein